DWPLANAAEALLRRQLELFLSRNSFARRLADRMLAETGTDFFEWIDHLTMPSDQEPALREMGFVPEKNVETPHGQIPCQYPHATLPRVLMGGGSPVLALRPEYLADFIAQHSLGGEPEGAPYSRFRRMVVSEENGTRLEAVERNAYHGFVSAPLRPAELESIIKTRELWETRPRLFPEDAEGFKVAHEFLERVLHLVNRDLA